MLGGQRTNLVDAEANAVCLLDSADFAMRIQDGSHGPSCGSLLFQIRIHAHQVAFLHATNLAPMPTRAAKDETAAS